MNDDEIVADDIDLSEIEISEIDIESLRSQSIAEAFGPVLSLRHFYENKEECAHDVTNGMHCLDCGEFVGDRMTDRAHDRMDMER